MINVTVVGFGYVGSALSWLLLNSQHAIRLNVMEPDPNCEGAFLDIAHGMPLFHNKEFHVNDEELFLDADFIYYAAGVTNTHGGSRLSIAQKNIQLTKKIFAHRVFTRTPYVIVITNPVDIISYAVSLYTGLPDDHVIGTGTFLDSMRLGYYLSTLSGIERTNIHAVVLGEHGDSQVPVYSMCRFGEKALLHDSTFSEKILQQAENLTKNAATKIRETQDGTTYGVSKCGEILLDYLLGSGEHSLSLSIKTNAHYRSLLQLDQDIYLGLPVTIRGGAITIDDSVIFSEEELNTLRRSARTLATVIEKYQTHD